MRSGRRGGNTTPVAGTDAWRNKKIGSERFSEGFRGASNPNEDVSYC